MCATKRCKPAQGRMYAASLHYSTMQESRNQSLQPRHINTLCIGVLIGLIMKIWWFKAKLKVEVYTLWTKSFITIQIINVTFNVIYNITIHDKIVIRTPSTYKCNVQCNYKMFCYVLGYIVKAYTMSSRYIVKAIHLEKTKCLVIWMEESTQHRRICFPSVPHYHM